MEFELCFEMLPLAISERMAIENLQNYSIFPESRSLKMQVLHI